MGVSIRLKELNPNIRMVGVTTKLGVSIQGLRNPKETCPMMLFRRKFFDEVVKIDDRSVQLEFLFRVNNPAKAG
ncbi:MAG: hypothetical protein FGF52_03555 [Candidatus Brockarchaeota archaeon]|nr:hypothetical protein [Candidatus Brockarchaeota archaeon]